MVPPFFRDVKTTFADEPNRYRDFVNLMKDYKMKKLDTKQVASKAAEIFEGEPELIDGFNAFLPRRHRLNSNAAESPLVAATVPSDVTPPRPMRAAPKLNVQESDGEDEEEESSGESTMPETAATKMRAVSQLNRASTFAVDVGSDSSNEPPSSPENLNTPSVTSPKSSDSVPNFFSQVKSTYVDSPEVYSRFLTILKEFNERSVAPGDVAKLVRDLFRGQPQLLAGFNQYLPKKYQNEPEEESNGNDEDEDKDEGDDDVQVGESLPFASETGDFSALTEPETTGDGGSSYTASEYRETYDEDDYDDDDEDEDSDENDDYDDDEGPLNRTSHSQLAVESLKESLALLQDEIHAKNDTAIIRVCRTCTQTVMELIADNDGEMHDSIHEHIVGLNRAVMQMLQSAYDVGKVDDVVGLIGELEVIYGIH